MVNFIESGWILLKLSGYGNIVNYKLSRSEVHIKTVQIMIKLDIHVFLPYSQILYDPIHKYCIRHPIFTESWITRQDINVFTNILWSYTQRSYDRIHDNRIIRLILAKPWLIHQYPIVFTKIVLVIRPLSTLTHSSVSSANNIWVVSWLFLQDLILIFFSILIWYCIYKHFSRLYWIQSIWLNSVWSGSML